MDSHDRPTLQSVVVAILMTFALMVSVVLLVVKACLSSHASWSVIVGLTILAVIFPARWTALLYLTPSRAIRRKSTIVWPD